MRAFPQALVARSRFPTTVTGGDFFYGVLCYVLYSLIIHVYIYSVDIAAIPPAEFKDGIISLSLPRKQEAEQKEHVQQIAIQ
jgi:hypothetical protein